MRWKYACNDAGNTEPARAASIYPTQLNRGTCKPGPSVRKDSLRVDGLWSYIQVPTTRAVGLEAIPTTGSENTAALLRFVLSQSSSYVCRDRHGFTFTPWRLQRTSLAIRPATYEWNLRQRFLGTRCSHS